MASSSAIRTFWESDDILEQLNGRRVLELIMCGFLFVRGIVARVGAR